MASYSTDDDNSANIETQIDYHKEMEDIANRAGDFTKAIITERCGKFTRP